jgi:hypothetical protein
LAPDAQPFIVASLCHVNPLAPAVAVEALALPAAPAAIADTDIATVAAAATMERVDLISSPHAAQDVMPWRVASMVGDAPTRHRCDYPNSSAPATRLAEPDTHRE